MPPKTLLWQHSEVLAAQFHPHCSAQSHAERLLLSIISFIMMAAAANAAVPTCSWADKGHSKAPLWLLCCPRLGLYAKLCSVLSIDTDDVWGKPSSL